MEVPKRKRVVIVGINYTNQPRLRLAGCHNDAKEMYKWWRSCGAKEEDILLLIDESNTHSDYMPTKSNIIKAFTWMSSEEPSNKFHKSPDRYNKSTSSYFYIFHYSGHGSQIRDNDGDEKDRMDETIVPLSDNLYSYTEINDDQIFNMVNRIMSDGDKTFMTFDSCHSGTVCDLYYKYDGDKCDKDGRQTNKDIVIISSALDNETSADYTYKGKGIGAGTSAFIHVMVELGGKHMTYGEVVLQMNVFRVKNVKHKQHHILTSSQPSIIDREFQS